MNWPSRNNDMHRTIIMKDGYPASFPSEWDDIPGVDVVDTTYSNDSCPSITFMHNGNGFCQVHIGVDLQSAREFPDVHRFYISVLQEDGDITGEEFFTDCEDTVITIARKLWEIRQALNT